MDFNLKNTKSNMDEVETLSNCNSEIHEHLSSEMEYVECPFCDKRIGEHVTVKETELCCDKQELINDEVIVCKNCGLVQGYQNYVDYIDFHKNKFLK